MSYVDGTDWTRETTIHKASDDRLILKRLGIKSPDVKSFKYRLQVGPTIYFTNSREKYEKLKKKFSEDIHRLGYRPEYIEPSKRTEGVE